jgi:hypothetical protein
MTYANFIRTKDGHLLAASDPDPEWFIDALCSGVSVELVIRHHQEDHPGCREISPQFWRILSQRIWDMLVANGEYDQATFDGLLEQGRAQEKLKTKKWKRRAKAYREELRRRGLQVPEVEDPHPEPTKRKALVLGVKLLGGPHEEHVLRPDDPTDPRPNQNGDPTKGVEVPEAGGSDSSGPEGDGAEEGGEGGAAGDPPSDFGED